MDKEKSQEIEELANLLKDELFSTKTQCKVFAKTIIKLGYIKRTTSKTSNHMGRRDDLKPLDDSSSLTRIPQPKEVPQQEANKSNHEEMCGIHDGNCYVCKEKTDSWGANPSMWSIFLPHIDGQRKHRYYHVKCLYPILTGQPERQKECE